ncbi:OS_HP3 family (seleno)protein, partial [Thermodesulfobacteriota bacterium]
VKNTVIKPFLVILILLVIPWSVYPQTSKQVPRLILKELEFDFGNVKEGSRISHDFTVINQGEAVLEIREVSPG